jgi:uncharacterized membrane protein
LEPFNMRANLPYGPEKSRPISEETGYPVGRDEFTEMPTLVTALYDGIKDARQAVQDLIAAGIEREQIGVVAADTPSEAKAAAMDAKSEQEESLDAGQAALIGGIGGLLIGVAATLIPGIGPVFAAGPLAAALIGVGAGSITGGLVGALIDLGLDEQEAEQYSEGVRRGGVLVTVQTHDTMTDRVVDVMDRHSPVDIQERAEEWYRSGWTGFHDTA